MKEYKNFKSKEFDSPDLPGSGDNMKDEFMELLQKAREIADTPFRITSGFRTEAYQLDLKRRGYKTAKNKSPHQEGYACDIACTDSKTRYLIIGSLMLAGFNRFGIGASFIHVDNSPNYTPNRVWTYKY
ncbi:MAG: hypothetical protein Unbinned4585contig1001_41 [Prokaryotic dsDNA virus sp.]|nr:MAG: hypothetical protein Unbinned4585contig1001_41 [Prokaryotic dsDNA virus sp.]